MGAHAAHILHNGARASSVARLFACALADGGAGIAIVPAGQRASILRELVLRFVDVVRAQQAGMLILLESDCTPFVSGTAGEEEIEAYGQRISTVIAGASGSGRVPPRIFSQMGDDLWKRGDHDGAARLEAFWIGLAGKSDFSLICGYEGDDGSAFERIKGLHTHVVSTGGDLVARLQGEPVT